MISNERSHESPDDALGMNAAGAALDPKLITALARAVMDPSDRRVLQITPANESESWVALATAVSNGDPFVTVFRRDVIGFDGDDEDSDKKGLVLAAEMEAAGLSPVVWASGRPGHAQVVVVCQSSAAQEQWRNRAKEGGFQWKRRSRGVLSPHRLGLSVDLVHPATPEEALQRLEAGHRRAESGRLTPRTMALLRHGDPASESGSEVVYRIAMGAAATGVKLEQIEAMLADPKNAGGDAYQRRASKSVAGAERWLRSSVWPQAEKYVLDHPPISGPADARDHIAAMRSEAAGFGWKPVSVERCDRLGRRVVERVSPTSLRRGLEGVLDLGDKQASIHIALSITGLIRASGLSKPTARKVRKVLQRQGWITQVHPSTTSRAGVYRINLTGERIAVPSVEWPKLKVLP